jgi:hypothetical protein
MYLRNRQSPVLQRRGEPVCPRSRSLQRQRQGQVTHRRRPGPHGPARRNVPQAETLARLRRRLGDTSGQRSRYPRCLHLERRRDKRRRDMQRSSDPGHSPPVPSQRSAVLGFLLGSRARRGSACTIITRWAALFAGRVRAVFGNTGACNLTASRGGPGDETPSSDRECGIFRSDRPCRFSGSSGWPRCKSTRIERQKAVNVAKGSRISISVSVNEAAA